MLVCSAKAVKEEDVTGVNVLDKEETDSGVNGDNDQRRLPESLASYLSTLAPSSM